MDSSQDAKRRACESAADAPEKGPAAWAARGLTVEGAGEEVLDGVAAVVFQEAGARSGKVGMLDDGFFHRATNWSLVTFSTGFP